MLVYTVGTFDLLHVGHLALLEQCRSLGNKLVVGVASDSVVNSYKPNVPVIPLDQRQEMLQALSCVDEVRPYYDLEYVTACDELDVDIFVVGEDWGKNPHNLNVEAFLESKGKQIVQVIYNSRTSSTAIKQGVMAQKTWHLRPKSNLVVKTMSLGDKFARRKASSLTAISDFRANFRSN
jgi:glycerol-3-phosphate cytidylyltransferase